MIEVIKTFLEAIDWLSKVYFVCWLVTHFALMYKLGAKNPLFMYRCNVFDICNMFAYVALFILLFLPSSLYK